MSPFFFLFCSLSPPTPLSFYPPKFNKKVSSPGPPEDEIQWILNEVEKYLDDNVRVRRADVLSAWQGFRPLASDPHAPPDAPISRDHIISINQETGITFITGGTYVGVVVGCLSSHSTSLRYCVSSLLILSHPYSYPFSLHLFPSSFLSPFSLHLLSRQVDHVSRNGRGCC